MGAPVYCSARASYCGGFSRCRARALGLVGLVIVVHRLSCSLACGIFLDQESNLCPLLQQADSCPLHHQGTPCLFFYSFFIEKFCHSLYTHHLFSSLLLCAEPWGHSGDQSRYMPSKYVRAEMGQPWAQVSGLTQPAGIQEGFLEEDAAGLRLDR